MCIQDWANFATIAGVFLGLVGMVFGILQLKEIKKATYANAYSKAVDILQVDAVRTARDFVMGDLRKKSLPWSVDDKKKAEIVCQSYDLVGIMIRNGMLPPTVIIDSWNNSLLTTWEILNAFVAEKRKELKADEFWDDFEYLASEAKKYNDKLNIKKQSKY
jgi:hypothetical protein